MRKTFEIQGNYVEFVYDTETEELSLSVGIDYGGAGKVEIWLPESRLKEVLAWLENAKRD